MILMSPEKNFGILKAEHLPPGEPGHPRLADPRMPDRLNAFVRRN